MVTSPGVEALNREAGGSPASDSVTEHIVHTEPAAKPHAGYRMSRQQLIVDEEWAQRKQRQINDPNFDAVHPTEDIQEQDDLRLHILEFSQTPKAFHDALDKDEDLNVCTAALQRSRTEVPTCGSVRALCGDCAISGARYQWKAHGAREV